MQVCASHLLPRKAGAATPYTVTKAEQGQVETPSFRALLASVRENGVPPGTMIVEDG